MGCEPLWVDTFNGAEMFTKWEPVLWFSIPLSVLRFTASSLEQVKRQL